MFKHIAMSALVVFMMTVPSMALAEDRDDHGDHGGDRDDHGGARAPEPLTMIGLGLGAAGIVAARLRSRKAARKP